MVTRFTCDKLGWLLQDDRLQFFGINGKCCTDKFFSNYFLDVFPISGDFKLNSFGVGQLKGELFIKTMNSFFQNTEGGSNLKLINFCKFADDYTEEIREEKSPNSFSLAIIFLWNLPTDLEEVDSHYEVAEELINEKDGPTLFWFIYFGVDDGDKIQTLDGRKGYLVQKTHRVIGSYCRSFSVCASYKSDPEDIVNSLLADSHQIFAYINDKKEQQSK